MLKLLIYACCDQGEGLSTAAVGVLEITHQMHQEDRKTVQHHNRQQSLLCDLHEAGRNLQLLLLQRYVSIYMCTDTEDMFHCSKSISIHFSSLVCSESKTLRPSRREMVASISMYIWT